MPLEEYSSSVVSVVTYLDLFQTKISREVSERLRLFCNDVGKIIAKFASSEQGRIAIWACLDRVHPAAISETARYFKSNVDVRIDITIGTDRHVRVYAGLSMSFLNPTSFDFLSGGRQSYRQWLMMEFANNLRVALSADGSALGARRAALESSRIWFYGERGRVLRCDNAEGLRSIPGEITEPEDAFEGPYYVVPILSGQNSAGCSYVE